MESEDGSLVGESRHVEDGWRTALRRRIWERRKADLREGTVLEVEEEGSIDGWGYGAAAAMLRETCGMHVS